MRPAALCLTALLVTCLAAPVVRAEGQPRDLPRKAAVELAQPVTLRLDRADRAAREEVKAAVRKAAENRPRGRLWCVPFARAVSGVDIRGNARTWWDQAKGRYQRSKAPKVGAVMAFAASGAMPKGHVAVVSGVVDSRRILIDQANWVRDRITVDTLVVDVSPQNDWSQVRVANGAGGLGRINPVKGFIWN
ncbi:CHAP domain-containing protein [Rhodobacteraceae bacterium HSP-20]|uniref:CHAP domain-containing protein n=1 Tax=Paragemmobacter amnigenus TaxID=2852097 RepID=A0ABS6JAQ5_9RHOB|nr:CHAP domain-containing protein [Rhodobacter amnigenus]MBU9699450.1 CHAP domain-containing protein [Rhodobacter amnigenus]MBV4390677.1 CHAP domain-containing protein [Rhodobacter amnigenus]